MSNLETRIIVLAKFGDLLRQKVDDSPTDFFLDIRNSNPWFDEGSVKKALLQWANTLTDQKLNHWSTSISEASETKKVGIVAAGNIPLVFLHDLVSVFISGHRPYLKASSSDLFLSKWAVEELNQLIDEEPNKIVLAPRLNNMEAIIATGSNSTKPYFEYYFKDIPSIIRHNRTSIAVLDGKESIEDLGCLGDDIFSFYGLGCRNVSKILLPKGYAPENLFPAFEEYEYLKNHHRFYNNYEYNLSVFLVNKRPHFINEFFLLTQDKGIGSPISVLFYDFYEHLDEVQAFIDQNTDEIQIVVSGMKGIKDAIPFGQAQNPGLEDYADNINTLDFLSQI